MPAASVKEPIDLGVALLEAWDTNERINQYLLASLDQAAWHASAEGTTGRTIASIFAHVHNVRHMWLITSGTEHPIPQKIDRRKATMAEMSKLLADGAKAMRAVFEAGLARGGRVKDFRPDVLGFFAYALSHEAHHRGQICLQAKQQGYPLSKEAGFGMWEWTKRWKEAVGR